MYTLHSPLCYTMLFLPDGPVSPPGRCGVLPALPPAGELPLPPPHPPPHPQEPAGPEGGIAPPLPGAQEGAGGHHPGPGAGSSHIQTGCETGRFQCLCLQLNER